VPVQALLLERSYALLFPAGSRAAAAAAYATAES